MNRPRRDQGATANLTIKIQEATRARMLALLKRTEAASLTELIRRAITAYEVLVDASKSGSTIVIRNTQGVETRVVVLI